MKFLIFCLFFLFGFDSIAFDHSHKKWNELLKTHLNDKNQVNYSSIKKQPQKLNEYLKSLENLSYKEFEGFDKNQKKAFLINAYNAFTIKLIVDNYPISSIKKIGGWFKGAWDIEFFSLLGGRIKSLDPIEHEWLRPKFKDYRIHAAVNCASVSCPDLRKEAYKATSLDKQLDEQMSVWLNDTSKNKFKANTYTLSKIFDWYESDFKNWGGGVLKVIKKHKANLTPDENTKLKYLSYNWELNSTK